MSLHARERFRRRLEEAEGDDVRLKPERVYATWCDAS